MMPVAGETSLAKIQSQPLRRKLGPGVGDHVLGLGGKADDQRRAAGFAVRDGRQDVGIFDQPELLRPAFLLS